MSNIVEVQIWMQHITYKMYDAIHYTEPLCLIVANEPNVSLWNIDWVKMEYGNKFPHGMICTDWLRDNSTPIIDIDEVLLFEVY